MIVSVFLDLLGDCYGRPVKMFVLLATTADLYLQSYGYEDENILVGNSILNRPLERHHRNGYKGIKIQLPS